MSFKDLSAVEARLLNDSTELRPEEVRDLLPHMPNLSVAGERRLNAELSLQNLQAVQQFEKSSSELTRWLIGLTAALVLLTFAVVYFSYVLAQAGKKIEPRSQTTASKKTLGPWQAKLKMPSTAALPVENPVINCSLSRTPEFTIGYVNVTFTNLADQSYVVKYVISGYNAVGQRVSEGADEFAIGKRESVVRKNFLSYRKSLMSRPGSLFMIQMELREL